MQIRKLSLFAAAAVLALGSFAIGGVSVGEKAPQFSLQDQDGRTVSLGDYHGKIIVLEWINPQCPYVRRHARAKTMLNLADQYKDKDVVWLGIDSTRSDTQADDQAWIRKNGLPYPVLDDSNGQVGKAYGAKTTPHMFVIDKDGKVVYEGAIDNDQEGDKGSARVNYVSQALDEVLAGNPVSVPETKPYGCGVKYK